MPHDDERSTSTLIAEPPADDSNFAIHHVDERAAHDASRPCEPDVEHELRSRRISRCGLLLVLAFLLPVAGMGTGLSWPQFSMWPGFSLLGAFVYLPLVAGIGAMVAARRTQPPLRSLVVAGSGLALYAMVATSAEVRILLTRSSSSMPGELQLSLLLVLFGIGATLLACRVRRYRPLKRSSYWVAVAGAAAYVAWMFWPLQGHMVVTDAVRMWQRNAFVATGLCAHIALMLAAAFCCMRNTPDRPTRNASRTASLASKLVVAAIVVPIAISLAYTGLQLLAYRGSVSDVVLALSASGRALALYGGLTLLIPVGIADLWVGRS